MMSAVGRLPSQDWRTSLSASLLSRRAALLAKRGSSEQHIESHGAGQSLPRILGGGRQAEPAVVGGAVEAARRGVGEVVADALADFAQAVVDGQMGYAEAEQRLEQRKVNDLSGAGLSVALVSVSTINRHHAGHCAEYAGNLVGQGHRRQIRRSVGKAGHADVAAHALGDGAKAGSILVRAGLSETGETQDDQTRVHFGRVQVGGAEVPAFQGAGAESLNQDVGLRREAFEQGVGPAGRPCSE